MSSSLGFKINVPLIMILHHGGVMGDCVHQPLLVAECNGGGVIEGFVDMILTDQEEISLPSESPPHGIVCSERKICQGLKSRLLDRGKNHKITI